MDPEASLPWLLAGPALLFGLGSALSLVRGALVDAIGFATLAVLVGAIGLHFRRELRR